MGLGRPEAPGSAPTGGTGRRPGARVVPGGRHPRDGLLPGLDGGRRARGTGVRDRFPHPHPSDPRPRTTARAGARTSGVEAAAGARALVPVTVVAYPNGTVTDYDEDTKHAAEAAGYRAAVTCRFGWNGARTPPFELRRVLVDPSTGEQGLATALTRPPCARGAPIGCERSSVGAPSAHFRHFGWRRRGGRGEAAATAQ